MQTADVVVVGSGIAGVSVAHHLAVAGVRRVTLIERETLLGSHASSRNAAIFLPVERGASMRLAARQCVILDELFDRDASWLRRTGAILLGASHALGEIAADLLSAATRSEVLGRGALVERVPCLEGGDAERGLSVPDSGVIDVHAVMSALVGSARARGVVFRARAEAARIVVERDRVVGVAIGDGSVLACRHVVLAGGAWSDAIGATCGAPLPLVSMRRHLAWLGPGDFDAHAGPIVWRLDDEVYFRPESGGVLASPCDEEPWPACVPAVEPRTLEVLAQKLLRVAPALALAPMRRAWACLRTFAPDRVAIAGADPRIEGLSWLAGLGGQGMTIGVAAAEVTAQAVVGRAHPEAEALSAGRLELERTRCARADRAESVG